ncbi:MAG TPA: Holliday junction branch migration protein RuvA [Candidatus Limnocylindrales bacterium]|nr:Holliday junction branch migration protein RuvA [Candidatus Limnocylindrales bacterium]
MIDYLKGRLVETTLGKAVIELGGVGIAILVPPATDDLHKLIGQEIALFTRLLIKEEDIFIYGFRTAEERKLFNLVLGVSGFGPRLALSLLGIFSVSQLYLAVLEENIPTLCRAHGVGRKAAQRLVLELKEKLPKVISAEELSLYPTARTGSSVSEDIIEALCALGYSRHEAAAAVSKAAGHEQELSHEELLKHALKSMTQG